jgi:Non-ribosomal peptide synthetase modules and related proteins
MNILPICDEQQYIFDVNEAIESIPMKITYSMEFSKSFPAEELSAAAYQCIKTADVFAARCVVKDSCQYIEFMPYQKPHIPVYDFSTEEEYQMFFNQVRTTKINNREKLYYIFIYSIAGSYYHINFSFNHLIFDGMSGILLSEKIQKVLNDNKEEMIWHPFSAYLNRIKNYRESQKYLEDTIFWEDRFLELSRCNYLFSEVITICESSIKELSYQTEQKLKEELIEFCSKNDINLYCLIATVFARILSDKTRCKRFYFEIPIANRLGTNDKNSFGLYEVTFPFIFDFDRYQNLSDLLESVQKQSFDYYRHNNFDWNAKILSEQYEKKFGKYIPQLSFSYFCTNKEPSFSFATLNYHHCETDLFPMTIYISDYLDWRTITFHFMYWDNYFTEQEIVEIHQKLENQIKSIIEKNGL